jgi:hypothetical protein
MQPIYLLDGQVLVLDQFGPGRCKNPHFFGDILMWSHVSHMLLGQSVTPRCQWIHVGRGAGQPVVASGFLLKVEALWGMRQHGPQGFILVPDEEPAIGMDFFDGLVGFILTM